jgi:hypothetical protein
LACLPMWFQNLLSRTEFFVNLSEFPFAHNSQLKPKLPLSLFLSHLNQATNHVYSLDPSQHRWSPRWDAANCTCWLARPNPCQLAVATAGALNSLARTVPADSFRIKRALRLLHRDTPPQLFVLRSVLTGLWPSSFIFWSRTRFA